MKARVLSVGRVAVTLIVWLFVSFVPLVPVMQAPVVPEPLYEPTLVSIQDLVGVGIFRLGVRHHATWATLPVMIGLTGVSLVGGWRLGGVIFGQRASTTG
jgi:hypothetical protein